MRRRLVLVVIAVALPHVAQARSFAHEKVFVSPVTRPIADALAASVARAIPLTAASPGVTFTFDKETHGFERRVDLLGQLYLERPRPLGRQRWNVALDYEWVRLDTVDGKDLDDLSDTRFPISGPVQKLFTVPQARLGIETHVLTTSVTYGVTDDLDLNLTVPLLTTDFRARFVFQAVAPRKRVAPEPVHDTKTGVGDLFLRAKYHLVRGAWGDLAAGLVVRMPTGDQDNFQGTGTWEPAPMLYGATPSLLLGRVRLDGYANGGVELNADDVARSAARFGAGMDAALAPGWTAAVAVLGREEFAGFAPPGHFDLLRTVGRPFRRLTAPFLGLQRDRVSAYDLSVGGRVDLWRDTVFGFANVLVPLNRDGFRSDVIPLAGFEAAF